MNICIKKQLIGIGFGVIGAFSGPVLSLDMVDADKPLQESQMSKGSIRIAHQEGLLLV